MLHLNKLRYLFLAVVLILFQESIAQNETQNPTFPFWKIRGNSGTDTSINFVGTTDAADLTLRTNNVRRVTITQGGFVGIGTIVPARMLELSGLTNGVRIGGLATGGSFITTPSATTDKLLYSDANGDVRALANGSSGQVLTINGSGVPTWTTSSSTDWSLTGNSGTTAGTNFIGTTDAIDWVIKTNNTERARFLSTGFFGVGLTAPGAYVDITGTSAGTNSLQLRSGNTSSGTTSSQVVFSFNNTTNYRHNIKTRHNSGSGNGNAIDFYLWNQGTDAAGTIGTKQVVTIEGNNGGMVGIQTTTPTAGLHVAGNYGILSTGTFGTGAIPTTGAGTRLMWYPAKAAFRAGSVSGTQWDDASIGSYSAAFGQNNTASGAQSVAFGNNNSVSGTNSFVTGNGNTVTATHALVTGNGNNAAGNFSVVLNNTNSSTSAATTSIAGGFQSQTQANLSFAIGYADTATSQGAVALGGFSNLASGSNSFATGNNTTASGAQSASFGDGNTVSGFNSLVTGNSNTVASTRSMVSGINNNVEGENNIVSGVNNYIASPYGHSIVVGYQDTLSGSASAVFGFLNKVTAFTGFAAGDRNYVSGQTGAAFGYQNVASGTTTFVTGSQDTAVGNVSSVFGIGNRAASWSEMAIGSYGTIYTASSTSGHNTADRVFNVGIGTSGSARANAFTILKGGNVRVAGLATLGAFITAPSATTDKLVFADANGDLRAIANGSSGQVLTINGSGVPAWSASSSTAWNLTGNASTVDGTNFIGTTDNIPFTVRTNNQQSGRVDPLLSNSFWGYWAGRDNSTGSQNVAVGTNALLLNTTGARNVAVGTSALENTTIGTRNTALGYTALTANTNGYNNTAIGNQSLVANTTGFSNVAVGTSALQSNLTGTNLVAVGDSALFSQNGGSGRNTAVGSKALLVNSTGQQNSAVGHLSLSGNTTGWNNTAMGYLALQKYSGDNNTAYGSQSLRENLSGNFNTGLGTFALVANTTGANNTGAGYQSLNATTTGGANSALGVSALSGNTTGHSNTAVGVLAGSTNTTGTRNSFLGDSANVTSSGLTNATAIGWNARISQSNSMALGSIQGDNGATATVRVGIGTNTPARALHIGNDSLGIRYEGVSTGGSFITATSATTDKILYADANGDIRAMTAGATGDVLTYSASGPTWSAAGASSGWALTGNASTTAGTNFVGTTDAVDLVFKTNSTEAMRIVNGGQVSINQTTPAAGDLFSVYSTNTDDAVNVFANGSGKGIMVSVSSANNSGDGIEVSKSGGTTSSGGRGIDIYMNTTTNGDIGLAVSHNGTGRASNFQQQNTGSSSPAVFATVAGTQRVIVAQNSSTSSLNAVGFFSQASTGLTQPTYQYAASVYGQSGSSRSGVFVATGQDDNTQALRGEVSHSGNFNSIGVFGLSAPASGYGYGVYGQGNLYGVYANGNMGASGTKPFMIDHPMDPEHKFLKHFAMESPEVLNAYRGNVVLDANGEATVQLPDYFHSINKDFSYDLTPIGAPTVVYVKREIDGNGTFVVAGGNSGQKISWCVYANRNDPYLQQKPEERNVVVEKKGSYVGKYLMPALYGQPEEKGIFYSPKYTWQENLPLAEPAREEDKK